MYNVLIADDHPVVLFGTRTFLTQLGYNVISTCANGLEAYNQILSRQPGIALLDMNMPGLNGLELLEKIQQQRPPLPVKTILLTMHNELSFFNRARELNVKGYLLKDFAMNEMEKCLEAVKEGNTYFSEHLVQKLEIRNNSGLPPDLQQLTFAERKILELVSQQKSTKEIAAMLFISEKTVETHRSHIIKKLNIPPGKNALLKWAMTLKD